MYFPPHWCFSDRKEKQVARNAITTIHSFRIFSGILVTGICVCESNQFILSFIPFDSFVSFSHPISVQLIHSIMSVFQPQIVMIICRFRHWIWTIHSECLTPLGSPPQSTQMVRMLNSPLRAPWCPPAFIPLVPISLIGVIQLRTGYVPRARGKWNVLAIGRMNWVPRPRLTKISGLISITSEVILARQNDTVSIYISLCPELNAHSEGRRKNRVYSLVNWLNHRDAFGFSIFSGIWWRESQIVFTTLQKNLALWIRDRFHIILFSVSLLITPLPNPKSFVTWESVIWWVKVYGYQSPMTDKSTVSYSVDRESHLWVA